VFGLLCLSVAALAYVVIAPPLDVVRDRLIDGVHARTGRSLTVAGPLSVSLSSLPHVVVSLGGVLLLPPDGMEGAATVVAQSIDAEMSLWSVLSRRPQLDRLTLNRPTIDLAIDAKGNRSWDLAIAKAAPVPQPPAAAAPTGDTAVDGAPAPKPSTRAPRPRPLAVRVVDGTVRYRDARSGASYEIDTLNANMTADNAKGDVHLAGTFAWQGDAFRFSAALPEAALRGEHAAQVALALDGASIEASYDGTLATRGGVSAEGTLSLARLTYKELRIGPGSIALSVNAGVAKATFRDLELYGGRAHGRLSLDTTRPAPSIVAGLKLVDISVQPLLKDAADLTWIDGRGTVVLALTALGTSERQILETLQGQVQLAVTEGGVSGIDIDKTMRALQRGRLDRLAARSEDRTPFSSLSGTFGISDGVARNSDLKLASTHVQLAGEGTIELVPRRIDYTLNTKIVGNADGKPADGAAVRIGTIELPVGIKGQLDRPEFTIKGQEALTDTIKQIGRNLRSREVRDAIKGLLSGGGEKRAKPAELIEKLLRKE
jgi:uncharacterized protein involved in outer membrane biogenesis